MYGKITARYACMNLAVIADKSAKANDVDNYS